MRIPGFIRRLLRTRQTESTYEDFKFDLFLHDLFHIDSVEELLYLEGRNTPEERARIEEHLAKCQHCRDRIADLRRLINE